MQVLALEVMSSFSHTSWGKLNIINNYIVDIKFSCKSVLGAYLNIFKKISVVSINSCSKGDMERRKVGGKPESSLPFRSMKESVKFIWFVTQFLSICSNLEQEDPGPVMSVRLQICSKFYRTPPKWCIGVNCLNEAKLSLAFPSIAEALRKFFMNRGTSLW